MLAQRECDLYFYVKRDCLLFSVNVKLFFEFFVMREKAKKRYGGPSNKSFSSDSGAAFSAALQRMMRGTKRHATGHD